MWRSESTISRPDRVLQRCEMYERIFLRFVLLFLMVYKDTMLDDEKKIETGFEVETKQYRIRSVHENTHTHT